MSFPEATSQIPSAGPPVISSLPSELNVRSCADNWPASICSSRPAGRSQIATEEPEAAASHFPSPEKAMTPAPAGIGRVCASLPVAISKSLTSGPFRLAARMREPSGVKTTRDAWNPGNAIVRTRRPAAISHRLICVPCRNSSEAPQRPSAENALNKTCKVLSSLPVRNSHALLETYSPSSPAPPELSRRPSGRAA